MLWLVSTKTVYLGKAAGNIQAYHYLIKDKAMPAGRTGEQQKKFHRCRGTKTNGKEWITMNLPKDPAILLSFVNTHLRDRYPSLEEFCKSTGVPMEEVTDALAAIDYYYQPDRNQFI